MAYIIAHGTVDGYRKITQVPPIGTEQSVLTDIRAEFDNTQTMLNKPCGYLIQMAEKGVWLSIIKLLFDGERSGNGSGFFSFSAFLPKNKVVSGLLIKQTLDNLLSQYLTKIGDDFTKNIGIDWSFVEQATLSLNANCQLRNKVANTNFKEESQERKKGFAYIDIHSDADIEQYLDKPFQPEYGEYRAVFLGTHLQNPNHLAAQTPLVIDFDNELYTIQWIGNQTDFPNLPTHIRKRDIESDMQPFSKLHYISDSVLFKDGIRDDANAEITLKIPDLKPREYKLEVIFNHPEAVLSLSAITNGLKSPRLSDDNNTISFFGEQVEMTWRISVQTINGYKDVEQEIKPYDLISSHIHLSIHIYELQTITIQLLKDGSIDTANLRNKVYFFNKLNNTKESGTFNKQHNCIQFSIPIADKDFFDIYDIRLYTSCEKQWQLSISPLPSVPNFYIVTLNHKQADLSPIEGTREIAIKVDKNIAVKKVVIDYDQQTIYLSQHEPRVSENLYTYTIKIPASIHRYELHFKTADGAELIPEIDEHDTASIFIKGVESMPAKIKKWLLNHVEILIYSGLSLLVLLALTTLIVFLLDRTGRIDAKSWFARNNDTEIATTHTNTSTTATFTPNYSKEYIELDSVYQSQQKQWNSAECKSFCEKYDHEQLNMKKNDSIAYVRLKQLSWLWRTREKLETRDWNHLSQYIKEGDNDFESKWKPYATSELLTFLRDVVKTSNSQKRVTFADKLRKDKQISTKSFNEIQEIWKNCQNQSSSSTTGHTQRSSNSNNNNSNNNSQPQENQQSMAGAEEF